MEEQLKAVIFLSLWIFSAFNTPLAPAQAPGDILEHPTCKYCDMNRQHFAHSRMLNTYSDNTSFGACSLYCAALNMATCLDKEIVSIEVADYNSREMIDAEAAYWVIGGNRPGVMTHSAKWAFRKKRDAERFAVRNGGALATFDEALKTTYMGMYMDSKMIRGKRKIRKMHTNPPHSLNRSSPPNQKAHPRERHALDLSLTP
jgi:nitrous oxide reductase accessory protein NosL